MGRQTHREQSREKSQCLQSYFSGNTQEDLKIRAQHENKVHFQIYTFWVMQDRSVDLIWMNSATTIIKLTLNRQKEVSS